ncbi:SigE family RNA polymerase sigma factor [Virgisporangium aurantiacum]|uniref:DNA-directed RNA polymerase sigma-70 factor n=1 Tax=Virgisporangium aurantiacum TaxID=175570 RepID=A0A8J3ZIL9_9ACTN|nr:SigE family RNA polymerase sigma factor [Virgisporangium aurantiacum]GIJ63468.1 DNA-directed RNA polymerase sigma-70 factor [Virgisporangium aurantiacum]
MSETRTVDAAYAAFVAANWGRYLRVARLLTGDVHRGEELLQDSLVKLYVRWRRASIRGDPHAYLRRTLINGNISWWRRWRREQLVADPPDYEDPRAAATPQDQVRRALRQLPRGQRAVVVLRHYEDLTEREVATLLRCTVGTVKSQNARALAKLRELLVDYDLTAKEGAG